MSVRAERAKEAVTLRSQGLTAREIGEALGISRAYASELYTDPDGEKLRARRDSYRGTCENCGAATDGSNGREAAPSLCCHCAPAVNTTLALRGRGPVVTPALSFLAEPHHMMDVCRHLKISPTHTSVMLNRLMHYGMIVRLRHGVYVRADAA